MKKSSLKYLDGLSDEELLEIVRSSSEEIDKLLNILNKSQAKLVERGWHFVNWPSYEKVCR